MSYNELRKDYLLNRWVVIATERARRPTDFAKPKSSRTQAVDLVNCPLCPGNEQKTPPAVLIYQKTNGEITKTKDLDGQREKNWLVRCIPNMFPAFSPPKQLRDVKRMSQNNQLCLAVGHHEVLVESPNHDDHPADASLPQLMLVINAYIDRLRELAAKPYIKYVSIFRNYGQEAGASLTHTHSQIIATPSIPNIPREELQASKKHYAKHNKCIFCNVIEQEAKSPRLILDNEGFVVIAPYASINPMEFWIIPRKHASNPLNLTHAEIVSLAETLKTTLKALKNLVSDPPYNYGFHLTTNKSAQDYYHWHIEVYPRLSVWAGFEKNTGMYINTVTPETAAAELKKALSTQV